MANNVQWIKIKVGMFDGDSFKRIKRAKIGGLSYRDKLTAVWFELLDLAGKSNSDGFLINNNEIAYSTYDDIAIMLDREEKEIELCIQFFISEKMVEIINDIYHLTNWCNYQNVAGLEKIREQRNIAQAKWRKKQKLLNSNNVDTTVDTTNHLPSIIELELELDIKESTTSSTKEKAKRFIPPTLKEVESYCLERKNGVDCERFIDFYTSKNWYVGKNKMKDWKACVRTWEAKDKEKNKGNESYAKHQYTEEQLKNVLSDFDNWEDK